MKFDKGPLADWFGHTRRERRSSIMLLAVILMVLAVRHFVPEKNMEAVDISATVSLYPAEKNVQGKAYSGERLQRGENYLPKAAPVPDTVRSAGADPGSNPGDPAGKRYSLGGRGNRKSTPLDLNRCDSADLERLPGIGPVLAARIIKYRKLLGGYASAGQLGEVYGLPPETLGIISGMVTANPEDVTRVDINIADFRELSRIRYLEKYEISSIIRFRELNGPITGIEALMKNNILSEEKAGKVKPYLKFR